MIAKFISTSNSNQNIKLKVKLGFVKLNPKHSTKYYYNKNYFYEYTLIINNSSILLEITKEKKSIDSENFFIGSFIYDQAIKFNASSIDILSADKKFLDCTVFEFLRKDFIFNKYLTGSKFSSYKSSYLLSKKKLNLLSSIEYLKNLVSEPSNIIYPETFVSEVKNEINPKNVKIKLLDENKIKKIGLNCLLAVSQGSNKKPRVVEFFQPKKKTNVDILFVGKGVCFDSGGISIKPSSGMEDMKWDMAGAAVVSSIIRYLSYSNVKLSYAGIIGLVENMPSGTAYKPGDVIKSYKGINVEVLNTDAEGRLVLADIISYGSEVYKPKIIIDFATLTGAIMVALGQHYAGLYSNDDELARLLYESGLRTNEKVWRMPLHEDFDKELNSPFVDLKNITNTRYGGSVTAAQFLQRFVPKKTKWVHLDIAGVSWKQSGDEMNNKGATGFGLTLISDFIDRYF